METKSTFMKLFQGQKFDLGDTVMTCGIKELVDKGELNPVTYIRRHALGDWGDVCNSDKERNDEALNEREPGRLFSSYKINDTLKVWVITEWDRSVTTMLLPSEY